MIYMYFLEESLPLPGDNRREKSHCQTKSCTRYFIMLQKLHYRLLTFRIGFLLLELKLLLRHYLIIFGTIISSYTQADTLSHMLSFYKLLILAALLIYSSWGQVHCHFLYVRKTHSLFIGIFRIGRNGWSEGFTLCKQINQKLPSC